MPFKLTLKDVAGNVMHLIDDLASKSEAEAVKSALLTVTQASFADIEEYAPEADKLIQDGAKAADEVAPFVPAVAAAEPVIDEVAKVADTIESEIVTTATDVDLAAAGAAEHPTVPAPTEPPPPAAPPNWSPPTTTIKNPITGTSVTTTPVADTFTPIAPEVAPQGSAPGTDISLHDAGQAEQIG